MRQKWRFYNVQIKEIKKVILKINVNNSLRVTHQYKPYHFNFYLPIYGAPVPAASLNFSKFIDAL